MRSGACAFVSTVAVAPLERNGERLQMGRVAFVDVGRCGQREMAAERQPLRHLTMHWSARYEPLLVRVDARAFFLRDRLWNLRTRDLDAYAMVTRLNTLHAQAKSRVGFGSEAR